MNTFRQIFEECKESFIKENSCVWKNSLKPLYCIIVDGKVESSNLPYILDSADEAFVICQYTYTVITQSDCDWFLVYMNKNGKVEDYIIKDGWKFKLNDPATSPYRSSPHITISKDDLKFEQRIFYLSDFDVTRIWTLFEEVRKCSSKIELEYLKKLYEQEQKIESLTKENAKLEYQKCLLDEKIKAYKALLTKIEELVNN